MHTALSQIVENRFAPGKARAATRVVVAMSGGVDSSTVAALLHDEGYEVIGITLQLYDHGAALAKKGACCAGQDIQDAADVANTLGIPHYVLNYESLFRENVMEDFADSYMAGFTPIPCVKCNQSVKFRDLLKVAKDLNADALATGHYVQRKDGSKTEMHRGADPLKDQSYFLFATTQEQLDFVHFPLGHLTKAETRELAQKYGLAIADKPDSQDICFVPNGNYASVVEKLRPGALDAGDIVHIDGRVLGQHEGIIRYTIGQRRGLGIGGGDIYYVIKLDAEKKQVIVGPEEALFTERFEVENVNWLGDSRVPADGLEIELKVRARSTPVLARLYPSNEENKLTIALANPERAVTPGQAGVFYIDSRVLGGGWINKRHIS